MSATRWRRGGRLFKLGKVVDTLWDPHKRVMITIEGDLDSKVAHVTKQIMASLALMSRVEETLEIINRQRS